MTEKTCRHEHPGFGPYEASWPCQQTGWHTRHRFHNYTWLRIPSVWRVPMLFKTWRTNLRLTRMGATRDDGLMRYSGVLYPKRFDPLLARRAS